MKIARETNAAKLKRLRADAKSRGLCYTCRFRFPRPGVSNCDECLARIKNPPSPAAAARAAARTARKHKAKRADRKQQGMCTDCGRYRSVEGYAACITCLDSRAATAKVRGTRPSSQGACSVCGLTGHNRARHQRPGVYLGTRQVMR